MAEPEDPDKLTPSRHEDDFDDDLVGFAHPRSLVGARQAPPEPEPVFEPEPEPEVEPEPILDFASDPEPDAEADHEPIFEAVAEPDLQDEPEPAAEAPQGIEPEDAPAQDAERPSPAAPEPVFRTAPESSFFAAGAPLAAQAMSADPEPSADYGKPGATRTFERPTGGRSSDPGVTADGDGRVAFAIYVCLIGAALTAGLTVVLALAIVWTARFLVKGWTRSHLLYQLRTSFIGTVAGVIGVATVPLGLGVFILSLTVVWVVVRGAAGLYRLVRRQPIRDPQTWSLP